MCPGIPGALCRPWPTRVSATSGAARTISTASGGRSRSGAIGRSTGSRHRARRRCFAGWRARGIRGFTSTGDSSGCRRRRSSSISSNWRRRGSPTLCCRCGIRSMATTARPTPNSPIWSRPGTKSTSGPSCGSPPRARRSASSRRVTAANCPRCGATSRRIGKTERVRRRTRPAGPARPPSAWYRPRDSGPSAGWPTTPPRISSRRGATCSCTTSTPGAPTRRSASPTATSPRPSGPSSRRLRWRASGGRRSCLGEACPSRPPSRRPSTY